MIPSTSAPIPTADSTEPIGSKRTRSVERVAGTTSTTAANRNAAIAATTKKVEPQ